MDKYSYDTNLFRFNNIVKKIFNVEKLELLHESVPHDTQCPDDPSKDQKTNFHKIFYSTYEDECNEILPEYRKFIHLIREKHFSDFTTLIYQTRPTFRVHAPGNIAVAKWHKDKLYNHSSNEINIFLPLTDAFDTNTIWSESEEDKEDYQPMNAKYGEYFVWNGANLNHGNKKNETAVSRVSLDFRVISKDNFNYSGTSVTQKVEMSLGKYWSEI